MLTTLAILEWQRCSFSCSGSEPGSLEKSSGIIANPNCSTIQMMVALEPIRQAFGLERIIVSTYQAVSGAGIRAINELKEQAEDF